MKKLGNKQVLVVVLVLVLLILLGGTYAYFSINASNDQTGAKVTGKAGSLGNPTLKINTSKLYLNLDANLMSEANAGKTYYANENENGLALTTNPNYTLATAQLPEGDEALDCTYNYKVTATVTTPITDNSDNDVKVVVGDKTMTLKELTTAGTNGIIVSGEIKNLTKGQSISIPLTSSVTNTANTQDKLVGNSYTIKIEPYTSGDTKAFSCKVHRNMLLTHELIASGKMYQTNLEGDGYRYGGSGNIGESTNPDNFICFGTTDQTACTNNPEKYMYRIIGVFLDSDGNNHVKLMKYKHLGLYQWNSDETVDISWNKSTLYSSLNGSLFLQSNEYDYFQNTIWSNKLENWTWSAVNTQTYYHGTSYYNIKFSQIYLNEMNRSSNTLYSEWLNPVAKIGLMYMSDYALSIGEESLNYVCYSNFDDLKNSWIYIANNNSNNTYEWTISRYGVSGGIYKSWRIQNNGRISEDDVSLAGVIRPVFYLASDVNITNEGDGSLENPFVIVE